MPSRLLLDSAQRDVIGWRGGLNAGVEPVSSIGANVDGHTLKQPVFPSSTSDFEDLFENGAVALHLVAQDGTILKANRAELELVGYDSHEYVGQHIARFHDDQEAIADILARLNRGEKIDKHPARLRAKDGSIKHVLISSNVQYRDGKFLNTRCVTLDVTELKLAQDKLRESEAQLRQLLDALPAAVYTTDAKGVITYYNPAAVKMAGRTPVVGKDEWCVTWKLYTPDGRLLPHDECPMAMALRENRAVRGVEAVAERPDGIRTPFVPFPTPIRDSSGKLIGAINMLVDVSDRKEAETRQQMLVRELNHRVKNNLQMLQSLLRTAERDSQNMEAKAVLAGATQRISAVAAAQRLLYEAESPHAFDAEGFLKAVCNSAQSGFCKDVTVEIAPVRGKLNNDISLPLALILNELLTNAIKHGINDGKGTVRVVLREVGDDLQLTVSDPGPGFEPSPETGRRSSGIGLVMNLARQIEGSFQVESDAGTHCTVSFPKARALP
jgi:PAS domain S-box-containing protein